jgi:DNA-binding transcriptional LysR family regulator
VRIEQLEYLTAVIQHGSLRRASERLHLSQPALSEAVTKLERELGVTLLDRRRSGARISRRGRELIPHVVEVLEAVDRLRQAAGDQAAGHRVVRVGTVSTATSTLLVPAVRELRRTHPGSEVEVVNTQQAQIDDGLRDGTLDLGLVNLLAGDDRPTDLVGTTLAQGRPVAVLPSGHPLAESDTVRIDDLRAEPFVAMRAGYLMHRFAHRLFQDRMPSVATTTDGAELGLVMVAQGLGLTVLPDYSVVDDPLVRAGLITHRPLASDRTVVLLELRQRIERHSPEHVRALVSALTERAVALQRPSGTGPAPVASQGA